MLDENDKRDNHAGIADVGTQSVPSARLSPPTHDGSRR